MTTNTNEAVLSGKEQAKRNKRINFYSRLERLLQNDSDKEILIPISFHKQAIITEYDDVAIVLDDHTEVIKDVDDDTKSRAISLPDIDEGYFLKNMSKNGLIEILKEEVFENEDGTIRKGSTGSIDDYNYQSAYNYYFKVLKEKEFLAQVEKEKDDPTTYDIPVKMKKIPKKKYIKTYRYPRRRRR